MHAERSELRISSVQWAVGGFSAAIGALMLVEPFQFAAPGYAPLRPYLAWWGLGFVLAGMSLLAVAALAPRFRFLFLAHLWAGGMLLVLAVGFALGGSWIGPTSSAPRPTTWSDRTLRGMPSRSPGRGCCCASATWAG